MNRLLQFFSYEHLPPNLQPISRKCCELASAMDAMLPEGAEKTAGMRKLLEAKDAFVRAAIEKPAQPPAIPCACGQPSTRSIAINGHALPVCDKCDTSSQKS